MIRKYWLTWQQPEGSGKWGTLYHDGAHVLLSFVPLVLCGYHPGLWTKELQIFSLTLPTFPELWWMAFVLVEFFSLLALGENWFHSLRDSITYTLGWPLALTVFVPVAGWILLVAYFAGYFPLLGMSYVVSPAGVTGVSTKKT